MARNPLIHNAIPSSQSTGRAPGFCMRLRSLLLALLLSQHHRRAFGFLHVQPTTPAPRHHHNTRMTMDPTLTDDEAGTAAILETTCSYALQVLNGMADRPPAVGPPSASAPAAIPLPLPEAGQGFTAALNDFQGRWAARLSGSAGPRYLGFVVGGSTPAALAGDWLVGAFDQNPQTTTDTQATWLEREALGWLRALLGLSGAHRGSFVSGATQSNMVGLAVAREWCGRARGVSVSEDGLAALGPVRVLSGCPHSSVYKALSILGLGKGSMELVPLIDGGEGPERREAVDVAALEAALKDNPRGLPTIVVANAGTVNTGDFDAMAAIVALREEKGLTFWLHVDAAFGAFAALDPERAPWLGGWDKADRSVVVVAAQSLLSPHPNPPILIGIFRPLSTHTNPKTQHHHRPTQVPQRALRFGGPVRPRRAPAPAGRHLLQRHRLSASKRRRQPRAGT